MKVLVTGGAGFIGSNFARHILKTYPEDDVVVIDKLTYAGRMETIADLQENPRFEFVHGDICDAEAVLRAGEGCQAIVNFAAESHVDRSIEDSSAFIDTAVGGTFTLLDMARRVGVERYIQISTDEVYGSIDEGLFVEDSPLRPSSPYSASKASGDLFVGAYSHTYGLQSIVCRSSNNYGPFQHPEKLIPLCILNALEGDKLPVYGDGLQVRDWLFVEDNCRAIDTVLRKGTPGEVYCIGGGNEWKNIDVIKLILELTRRDESQIDYVTDRPGHDRRYALSNERVRELGWEPRHDLPSGLAETVAWYVNNEQWWKPIRSGLYRDYYAKQYGSELKS